MTKIKFTVREMETIYSYVEELEAEKAEILKTAEEERTIARDMHYEKQALIEKLEKDIEEANEHIDKNSHIIFWRGIKAETQDILDMLRGEG